MGAKTSLPMISRRGFDISLQYNAREKHLIQLYHLFLKHDVNCNGVWTLNECYELVMEPRVTMAAPFIDSLFFMADKSGTGQMSFEDFIVSHLSFCALGKEEILQFMFIVMDTDQCGYLTRTQLRAFYSQTRLVGGKPVPLFPKNCASATEAFCTKHGNELIFDQFAQLCEIYPLVGFAAFHLQFLLRNAMLGMEFWKKWDADRLKVFYMEAESVSFEEEVVIQQEVIKVTKPGRFVFKDILEYGRRKSYVEKGKKVSRIEEKLCVEGNNSDERDEAISRTPVLNVIRNPKCLYHVPYLKPKFRPREEVQQVATTLDLEESEEESVAAASVSEESEPAS